MKMNHVHFKVKKEAGIGIVEVIAALGLSVVVLTSLVSLSLFSLRTSLHSKLQLEGTKLANRELELIRAFRDGSATWQNGTDGFLDEMMSCTQASPCHMEFASGLAVGSGADTEGSGAEAISRSFYATTPAGGTLQSTDQEVRINVSVTWQVGDDTKYARLYTDLTNWSNK
jgi:Tfp pilus assembly protein PilV